MSTPRWLKLVLALMCLIIGLRAILTQHISRWFPEVGASGSAAIFVGILFLAIAAICFYGWLQQARSPANHHSNDRDE